MFTRNPQGWKFSPLKEDSVKLFKSKLKKSGISKVIDHMPYLPNLSSPVETIYEKSVDAFIHELGRVEMLDIDELVVHLGSHMGKGQAYGQRDCGKGLPSSSTTLTPKNLTQLNQLYREFT